jgi:hypothetical protein
MEADGFSSSFRYGFCRSSKTMIAFSAGVGTMVEEEEEDGGEVVALGDAVNGEVGGGSGDRTTIVDMEGVVTRWLWLQREDGKSPKPSSVIDVNIAF